MADIPDAPWVRKAELYGDPWNTIDYDEEYDEDNNE